MHPLLSRLLFPALMLATPAFAQTMPYAVLGTLDQAAKESQGNKHVRGFLRISHFNPEDKRPFAVTLKAPGITKEVEVTKDGEVILPPLPKGVWKDATVTHNLEKGALKVDFWFRFSAPMPNFYDPGQTLSESLEQIRKIPAEELAQISNLQQVLPPEMKGATFAITGLSLSSDGSTKGSVKLLRQGVVVQTCDLSKAGKTVWMLERFDPKTHSLATEGDVSKLAMDFVPAIAPRNKLPPNSMEVFTFGSAK